MTKASDLLAKLRNQKRAAQLVADEYGIEGARDMLRSGVDRLFAKDFTVEQLLDRQPSAKPGAASKAVVPVGYDAFFGDMLVPVEKQVKQLPADSPIYDPAFPQMRVLKAAPEKPKPFDWAEIYPQFKSKK